jgi:hypothetical protein
MVLRKHWNGGMFLLLIGDHFNDTIEECATELRNLSILNISSPATNISHLQILILISICLTDSNFQYYIIHRISW